MTIARTFHPFWFLGILTYSLDNENVVESWKGLNGKYLNTYSLTDIRTVDKKRFSETKEAKKVGLILFCISFIIFLITKSFNVVAPLFLFSFLIFCYGFYRYQYFDFYDKNNDFLFGIRFNSKNAKLVDLVNEIESRSCIGEKE